MAVLGIAVLLAVVHAVLPDPVAFWKPLLVQMLDSMQAGGHQDRRRSGCAHRRPGRPTMWGALGALTLATLLGSLFLGRWWADAAAAPGAFGAEYRQLRLGIALGIAVTVVFVLAMCARQPR